jgi:hypothetical protein
MPYYTIHLINASIVRPTQVLRERFGQVFGPLIEEAGYEPNIITVSPEREEEAVPDVSLQYVYNQPQLGAQFISGGMVLAEQSGSVLVGSILEMRVGGNPQLTITNTFNPSRPLDGRTRRYEVDPLTTTQRLFRNGEAEFAQAVANISIHELGHTIGGLNHHQESTNYMYTGARLQRDFGSDWRTHTNLRRFWSGPKVFTDRQRETLVGAIRERDLLGVDMVRNP